MTPTHLLGENGRTLCGFVSKDIVPKHPTCEGCKELDAARTKVFNDKKPESKIPPPGMGSTRPQTKKEVIRRGGRFVKR